MSKEASSISVSIHPTVDESVATHEIWEYWQVTCPECGAIRQARKAQIEARVAQGTFTGRCLRCSRLTHGADNPNWKGGRNVMTIGYVRITVYKDDPYYFMASDGRVYEHRLVMARHLGRVLLTDELVHHIDENRTNNAISNLLLMTKEEHYQYHQGADVGADA